MAHITPKLHRIAAAELPAGAYLEEASDGKRHYSLCPPKGRTEQYRFALYALPGKLTAGEGVGGPRLLHNLTAATPEFRTPLQGVLAATYTRQ